MRLFRHAAWLLLLIATPAFAQDAPDFGALAQYIRWGGVLASVVLLLGVFFVIRLLDNVSDRLSARFSNRRPTIQKVQTTARFFIYIAAFGLTTSLSVRLDPTAVVDSMLVTLLPGESHVFRLTSEKQVSVEDIVIGTVLRCANDLVTPR